jgi:hypothetical protein
LIDRQIDFDQWEFCVVWAMHISFVDVFSAVPPEGLLTVYGFGKVEFFKDLK